jgi:tRNA uridine 5-carboxymethylaminomethyl modification enzyme
LVEKERLIQEESERLKNKMVGGNTKVQEFLSAHDSTPLKTAVSMADLLMRPELNYELLAEIDPERAELPEEVTEQVEIELKYSGYIERQQRQVEQFKKTESRRIPENLDYDDVPSLRIEARQKLKKIRPENIGQASRISGVSPADISVLLVYLRQN